MKAIRILSRCGIVAVSLILIGGPLLAATAQTKDRDGNGNAGTDCDQDSDRECECTANWNPSLTCNGTTGPTILDVLDCLAVSDGPTCSSQTTATAQTGGSTWPVDVMQIPSGGGDSDCVVQDDSGAYTVRRLPDPLIGIEILYADGTEIDNLQLIENFRGIEWTEIELNRDGMEARIREIYEVPTSGEITVQLNDRSASVDTSLYFDGFGVTHALVTAIGDAGFLAFYESPWIIVYYDGQANRGLTKVGLVSTDSSIAESDIMLAPTAEFTGPLPDGSSSRY